MTMAITGVAGAAVAAGASAYSASQSGSAPGAPGPKSLATSTAQARDAFGGRTYVQDYEDALRYGALNSQLSGYGLFGSPAQTRVENYRTMVDGKFQKRSRKITTPGQEGLLSMLGRAQPQLQQIQRQGDERGYALMDQLTADASGMVGGYDPYEDHLTQQNLRQAQSARGMGFGRNDAFNEVLGLEMNRQDRRMRAGQYAGGVLGVRRGYMGDPTADAVRYLGAGQQLVGGLPQRSSLFNPQVAQAQQSAYAANLSNFNSGANNIAALGSGAAQMAAAYQQAKQHPPGYGPGNNYYSDPVAQMSRPY